jgi:CRP/FNR family cyclic AMP-dependent transcriptional regulator
MLASCALFQGLPQEARCTLAARLRLRGFRSRQSIFMMGMEGASLMALLTGKVCLAVSSRDGKEIMLGTVKPGDVFGEIAVLDGRERNANAVAMTDCQVAELDRADVLRVFDRYPTAWRDMVGFLCERLRRADQQIAEVTLLPLSIRLSKTLLRMCEVKAVGERSIPRVYLSQREIGSLVGVSRETVNKVFHTWQGRGLIEVDDQAIAIIRRDLLERISEGG